MLLPLQSLNLLDHAPAGLPNLGFVDMVLDSPLFIEANVGHYPYAIGSGAGDPQTISPTAHMEDTAGGGVITAMSSAYDGNIATRGDIRATNTKQASATFVTFGADSGPSARTSVKVRLLLEESAFNANDLMKIWFRQTAASAYVELGTLQVGDFTGGAEWFEYDVTALAGSNPSSGFGLVVLFANNPAVNPPPPEN